MNAHCSTAVPHPEQTVPSSPTRQRSSFLLAASWCLSACGVMVTPCVSPEHCAAGRECLANRCEPIGADPVSAHAARRSVEASGVAVVRSGSSAPRSSPPATVCFGGPPERAEELLLRFPDSWNGLSVDSAFLLLSPAPGGAPSLEDVPVLVSVVADSWANGVLEEAPAPERPSSHGWARTGLGGPLRVDVTEQVRAFAERPGSRATLLVRASTVTEASATYMTGIQGKAPRLEVYGHLVRRFQ
jgi:hypothetical protein